jgi:hypothetical protein
MPASIHNSAARPDPKRDELTFEHANIKHESAIHNEDTAHSDDGVVPGSNEKATVQAGSDGDISAKWLAQYQGPRPQLTDELNNQIRNKIDMWMLPIIFGIYFNQQLDKSAVSFSAVFGFRQDANLTGSQYAWLTTIVYLAQLFCQPRECIRMLLNWKSS